ncbi:replication-relaxation family protein [Candidatus Daviesbacteria bacterium]|nr:replication-relaxation family protein [Candidatus Daviesbacteria bacterium]
MSKKIITKKQQTILILIYIFRFLNSKQIQQFLNHKDHRRINGWLKDLREKEYVERDFKAIYGILTKPAIYFLTAKGRKHLKDSYTYFLPKYLKKISRDNKASKGFRIKCQIIGDWCLMLFPPEKNKSIPLVDTLANLLTTGDEEKKIPLNTWQFFTSATYPSFILLEKIKPDAYVRRKTTAGITHSLLFVLDAYVPRVMLQNFIKRIFSILDEEYWETDDMDTLHIYVLCPNNMVIIYLRRLLKSFLERYYGGKELIFHFATRNQLYKQLQNPAEKIKWRSISSQDEFDD